MHDDRYGLPLSAASAAAAEAYGRGLDLLLAAWPGAATAFEQAIALDPDFALAYVARARLHQVQGEAADARAKAAKARALAERATLRERQHVDVLARAIEGQPARALGLAEAHLDQFPRDAVVMSLPLGAFGLYAFSGRPDHDQARVALCERHARHYGEDWWFLTYLGWSHTEAGHVGAGRWVTERALALRPANANGAHALAHALHEQGAGAEADAFLTQWLPSYDRAGTLHGHLHWHQSLIALDGGDTDRALELYAERFGPSASLAPALNRLSDGAALLWRLGLDGEAPADAWREVAAYGESSFTNAGVHFADVHAALAAAATGDTAALARRIAALRALIDAGKLAQGSVVPELCRAFGAFADGDHAGAARLLEPLLAETVRIGGSHAQRELVEDTLIAACLKAGEAAKARGLLNARLARRPSARDARWLARAEAAAG